MPISFAVALKATCPKGHSTHPDRPHFPPPPHPPQPSPVHRYSERLVLIPGMGIVFDPFMPIPRLPEPVPLPERYTPLAPPPGGIIINLSWTVAKVNVEALTTLRRIVAKVQARLRWGLQVQGSHE